MYFQSGALQNTSVSSHYREFGITDSDERYRYFTHGNIQLGGPLSTNWTYFGSVSRAQAEKWVRNHAIAVPANLTSETANFSGIFPNGHRVGLSWIGQQASQPRDGITPQVDAESTRRTSRSFQSVQGSWAGAISARSVFDTGAAFYDRPRPTPGFNLALTSQAARSCSPDSSTFLWSLPQRREKVSWLC